MKNIKRIILLALFSSVFLTHAYCDERTEKENAEQAEYIKAIKDSWNQLFNNVSEMKKTVIKNYDDYKNENNKTLKNNVNIVIDKNKGK